MFHWSLTIFFLFLNLVGIFYFYVAIAGFVFFCLASLAVYTVGVRGIKKMVKQFDMSMPNQQATMVHLFNMLLFVFMVLLSAISEVLMLQQVSDVVETVV